MADRQISYVEALREAQDYCLGADPNVYLMGLGVPDPKGIFGSTTGLQEKHGAARVMDMPLSENAMTGIAVGSALRGMRPIMTHQRIDFVMVAMEQIINQAAKWHFMFGGRATVPLVIRMIIGRGWGQGPQHSQSLQSVFAHFPGLKVVMPTTAYDAKGMMIAAVEDNNPVIFLEHRWLYGIKDNVPAEPYRVELGKSHTLRQGSDVTIVSSSYMTLEALRAADILAEQGISADVIDLRTISPLDRPAILASVRKTGRLVVADTGWKTFGCAGEIIALATEEAFSSLKAAPARVCLPDSPTPTSPALADGYYPRAAHVVAAALGQLGRVIDPALFHLAPGVRLDVPDSSFKGPF